ncbi:phage tail protein [Myxococcota bacterium]|nr:phage tail protein [Myxococcota bacterium]
MRSDEIARLLPEVVERSLGESPPLAALVEVMDVLHAPVEALLRDLDAAFDPRRTRDDLVPILSEWTGVGWPAPTLGDGLTRELVARAASLWRHRGTARAFVEVLELATGLSGFELVEDAPGRPEHHVVVVAPAEARAHARLVERVVRQEKPAHVTFEITYR